MCGDGQRGRAADVTVVQGQVTEAKGLKPWATIVSRRYYMPKPAPPRSRPSVICKLSCGHSRAFKGSDEPKPEAKVVCMQCPRV